MNGFRCFIHPLAFSLVYLKLYLSFTNTPEGRSLMQLHEECKKYFSGDCNRCKSLSKSGKLYPILDYVLLGGFFLIITIIIIIIHCTGSSLILWFIIEGFYSLDHTE